METGVEYRATDDQVDETPDTGGSAFEEIDGYLWDPITGECMGPAGDTPARPQRFEVTDLQSAAWVLRRRGKAARRLADLQAAMQREIQDETDRIRRDFARCIERAEQALGWWSQYESQLEGVTLGETVGSRQRSIEVGGWRMGHRRLPGRIDIVDERLALAWAREHLPEAVVVKESIVKRALKGCEPAKLPAEAFTIVEPADKFYIEEA